MSDKRGYNGLRSIGGGGVPVIGAGMGRPTEAQLKQAIGQEIQGISRAIYVQAAASWMVGAEDYPSEGDYAVLAQQCQIAARAYLVGIGVIELEQPADSSLASAIATERPAAASEDEHDAE